MNKPDDNTPSTGDMAVIGEGTPNRMPVSIQVLQNIYHELTGKSEEVSKTYDDPFHVVFNDFRQLHHRISQACEQYNISATNFSVSVFYVNDTKDTFSSFERFEAFNAGSTSAVESVLLTYNFLIILPKLSQPQSYTISIRVASPVAIQRKINENMFGLPKIFKIMGGPRTAVVNVQYVDYAVARTLLNTTDEWFNNLSRSTSNALWKYLRRHTDYIPLLTRYTAGLGVAILLLLNMQYFIAPDSTLTDLARFGVLSFVAMFSAYKLAYHLGSAAEDSLDNWTDLSYVCITDGDKKEVDLAKLRNKNALIWGAIKLIGGLLISVIAKLIVHNITGA